MVYVAVLLLYAAILLAGSIAVARHVHDYRLVGWLPLVFATVHAGSGTGMLWELLWPARATVSDSTPGDPSIANG